MLTSFMFYNLEINEV